MASAFKEKQTVLRHGIRDARGLPLVLRSSARTSGRAPPGPKCARPQRRGSEMTSSYPLWQPELLGFVLAFLFVK